MVHEIHLFQLKAKASDETLENMMVETRIRLLKIPEVMNLTCGKAINKAENAYQFCVAMDFENLAKRDLAHDSAVFIKYEKQILQPHVAESELLQYEMEPGKDVTYS
ncbi:MAG: Dabb family protein [Verrucomicrobiota bacterium]